MNPDRPLKCLLVQPRFAEMTYWNFTDSIRTVGAKAISPPLGLLTVAALLPQNWTFRLLDLNVRPFDEADWEWADLVLTGGMLPQQTGILQVIERAKADGKFVAVGGPDPSSQPSLYRDADAIVTGEGEASIPIWLESWRRGQPRGVFSTDEKPDVTQSPVPRYDLIRFNDYFSINVQVSRGCPFNCEFCDIIELYGRKPRVKTVEQVLREFQRLYDLGYRGWLDVVDDNFIGNKRFVKRELLPAIIEWSRERKWPFYFSTECSMNIGDDDKLLELMREAGFRFIFTGIETPDPELLLRTQKSQNTMRPIVERVRKLYDYGIMVSAGFIMGLDGEKPGVGRSIIRCVEETDICMAMVGLLVALPNTQLSRRLKREGRLFTFDMRKVEGQDGLELAADRSVIKVVDQTTAGLNFLTLRDRREILREFLEVVQTIYDPKVYMDRVLRVVKALKIQTKRRMSFNELRRNLRGLVVMSWRMTRNPRVRKLYWRNFFAAAKLGPEHFERAMKLMGSYLHYEKQTRYLEETIQDQIRIRLDLDHPLAIKYLEQDSKVETPIPLVIDPRRARNAGLHAALTPDADALGRVP